MFECIIIFGVGLVVGMYITTQIGKTFCGDNNKLESNMNKWESSQKVKYKWREDEKRNLPK